MSTATHAPGAPASSDGAHRNPRAETRSLGEVFSAVTSDLSTLVRQEVALAKAEATESAARVGKGAGMFGGAALAGHFVLLFLSVALWWALGDLLGRGWSALITAGVWAVVAAVLAVLGRREIKQVKGLPRTAGSLKLVPNALRGREESAR